MRVLYIDIDSLRPDHLGCYSYHRNTSPNIDAVAKNAVRFTNCYVTDAPCLPSRTALWSGRNGFHNGAVGHGGTAADPFTEGPNRGFRDVFGRTGWMACLRELGFRTITFSSFGERHSCWHWYAGFNEITNPGKGGLETADEVSPLVLDWLDRNGAADKWFLHVNFWDPHTPYITPKSFGNPFADEPISPWYTEERRSRAWNGFGPHSAQEVNHFDVKEEYERCHGIPLQLDSVDAVTKWINGYDTGIRFMDDHIGRILWKLDELRVLEETVIIIGADHGENQGELNVWGDHQLADHVTCRVPLIMSFPGITKTERVDEELHYHYDWAATLLELLSGAVPENWDARSFADSFRGGKAAGRPNLVISQGAWSCQRAVRFDNFICIRTYHDGYKQLEPIMLFDLSTDSREENNIAQKEPQVVERAMKHLADWQHECMLTSDHDVDPLMTVLREGGPFHCRGHLREYLDRLRETGRSHHAERLANLHPEEC